MMDFNNVKDRSGYLGGTDAALVGRLGGGLRAHLNHFLRLAVAYGVLPGQYLGQVPKTEAMEAGHQFENYFFDTFKDQTAYVERQYILRKNMEGLPPLIAHADGYDVGRGVVLELKFSRYYTTTVLKRHRWQLQWYYFLGAKEVILVHGSGELPEDVRMSFQKVEKDAAAQEQLTAGLCRIREMRPRIQEVAEMIELKDLEKNKNTIIHQ